MPGSTPFNRMQLTEYPALAPQNTDTATPSTPIPMYFIHSVERPFCNNPQCKCHWQQQQVKRLLGIIVEGAMTLQEAASFLDEVNGEGK